MRDFKKSGSTDNQFTLVDANIEIQTINQGKDARDSSLNKDEINQSIQMPLTRQSAPKNSKKPQAVDEI